ncbi:hypothetical protein GCM10017621_13540 [Maricaulis virginensis]|uniref:Uncharacterized protein n=1 Tax=Maricaulis virginensis TaxID=144022 RepID=A0A9W6IMV6_9PROT|nr:hypothetical protein GCM10017621_13540 [Maricaulis virginensis]
MLRIGRQKRVELDERSVEPAGIHFGLGGLEGFGKIGFGHTDSGLERQNEKRPAAGRDAFRLYMRSGQMNRHGSRPSIALRRERRWYAAA